MDQQRTTANPANGTSTPHELFALTDEQILEIEPEGEVNVAPPFRAASPPANVQRTGAVPERNGAHSPSVLLTEPHLPSVILSKPQASEGSQPQHDRGSSDDEILRDADNASLRMTAQRGTTEHGSRNAGHDAQAGAPALPDPPAWLAAQMEDPWSGEDAKELWNDVQQAKQEAAAYRAAFATPEQACALKELYPGGVNEARAAANHAQLLNEIDRAYFGTAGATPEQTSAARGQLANMMLREDPAAFREMVFAGLRALEEAEKGSTGAASASNLPRLAQIFAPNRPDAQSAVVATLGSPAPNLADASTGGASPAPTPSAGGLAATTNSVVGAQLYPEAGRGNAAPHLGNTLADEAHLAVYAAFEKAANDDLERSVGAAIARTIEQVLPNLRRNGEEQGAGARHGVPLHERLGLAVRQDVEAALKGDHQLGEQIVQILAARRFDNETRAQVVRLIEDRARQLVPGAARRVINEWTQTTLAAHRGSAARSDVVSTRREVAPANTEEVGPLVPTSSLRALQARLGTDPHRNASRPDPRRLDYRKLSDEQILDGVTDQLG